MPLTWVRVAGGVPRIIITIMKRLAVQRWMARFGLAAALLLLLVPTTGRLVQAAANGGAGHAAEHPAHDAHRHAAGPQHRARGDQGDAPALPAADNQDCHYCTLLASIAALPHAGLPATAPVTAEAARPRSTLLLRWLHPNGLGSRGPPLHG